MNKDSGKDRMKYSVLMPVHAGEEPEHFRTAIRSMLDQTAPPDELVIVCDGRLTEELDAVIQDYEEAHPGKFQVVRTEKNRCVGEALNIGLGFCRNELVARMDSDDIALPNRCRLQLRAFSREPQLALCSGDIAEFEGDPEAAEYIRRVPRSYEQIMSFARKRNPMNHMAVMFRRSEVERADGYAEIPYAEDYELWVRMINRGCLAMNLGTVLVKARIGNGFYSRRGGWAYARTICTQQKRFLHMNFITRGEFVRNCAVRGFVSFLPPGLRRRVYRKVLRE